MRNKIFNSVHEILLENNKIEVSISQELQVWNDAGDKTHETKVNDFFAEFIHGYGIFHDLLGKSDAHGDNHELKITLINGNIQMEGKTYTTGEWDEDNEEFQTEETCFIWIFDKNGNVTSID